MESDRKLKILMVDDEADILKVVRKRLEREGYEVLVASGGKQALILLEKEIPDLILLDITMPDMDGIEVCRKIKEQKFISHIPVIFFTACGSVDDKIRGLDKGVHDYITKPIEHRELLARIKAVLKVSEHYNEISFKDELTGLYNYNFFERYFEYTFNLAKRYGRMFSLVIIDIDDFKNINDNYGHLCGNFVLKDISEKLRDVFRKVDIIVRYGGDEFAVVLPETNSEQASNVLARLRNTVREIHLSYEGCDVEAKSSIGSSTYFEGAETKETVFNIADRNMYEEKNRK